MVLRNPESETTRGHELYSHEGEHVRNASFVPNAWCVGVFCYSKVVWLAIASIPFCKPCGKGKLVTSIKGLHNLNMNSSSYIADLGQSLDIYLILYMVDIFVRRMGLGKQNNSLWFVCCFCFFWSMARLAGYCVIFTCSQMSLPTSNSEPTAV